MEKLFILLLSLSLQFNSFGADTNWAAEADSSKSVGGSGGTPSGSAADVFDENEATSYSISNSTGNAITAWGLSEFASSHTINRIKTVFWAGDWCGDEYEGAYGDGTYLIEYYDGSWHTADSGVADADAPGDSQTVDLTGLNYTSVTKVRLTLAAPGCGGEYRTAYGLAYELYAYGPPYLDKGVRIRTSSGTIKIGVETLDGHKLRVRGTDAIYGIPLITPGGAEDSGLRVYDGSNVKALPFVN